ncbi:MAG: hypothetical protein RJB42_1377 [Bacteroidota bacterium]
MTQTAVEFLLSELDIAKLIAREKLTMAAEVVRQAKAMEETQKNEKINIAIKEFENLKSKAESLKDIMYLDGVLAVLDSIKNK